MKLTRRDFLKNSTLLTSAFVIGFHLPIKGMAANQKIKKRLLNQMLLSKLIKIIKLHLFLVK